MTKKKKVVLSVVAVIFVLTVYDYFFGVQTAYMIGVRMNAKPQLDVVPVPLALNSRSEPVTDLKAFDYSFSVPWLDCSLNTAITSGAFWACSGSNFSVVCFSPRAGAYGLILSDTLGEYEKYRPTVERLLGLENVVNTNFYICKKVWEVTPLDVSLFDSKDTAAAKFLFLVLKAYGIPPGFRDVYFFEHDDIKGFQLGNLSGERFVELSIFDQMDRELCLIISASTNSPIPLTQADINTIITTFSSNP